MFLLIMIGLVAYTLAGMIATRIDYAAKASRWRQIPTSERPKAREDILNQLRNIQHQRNCNLMYGRLASQGCDCVMYTQWQALKGTIKSAGVPEPNYYMMGIWPLSLAALIIKGGISTEYVHKETEWLRSPIDEVGAQIRSTWDNVSEQLENEKQLEKTDDGFGIHWYDTAPKIPTIKARGR